MKSGLIDQRDRGRKRHRDALGVPATAVEPDTLLWVWLPEYLRPLVGPLDEEGAIGHRLFALAISDYARESAQFDCGLVDRLRLLAIYIEEEIQPLDRFMVWRAADRLYQEAARIDPTDAMVLSSRALTAHRLSGECGVAREADLSAIACSESLRATLIHQSWQTFSVAAECHYDVDTEMTLRCAESALALNPAAAWPALRRAHCLHDLKRYGEAAEAYRSVPKDYFKGVKSWRMDLLVEQLASCLWKSGQLEEAYVEFDRILSRYETQPHLAELRYLKEAVVQWPEFEERIAAVEARIPN